MDVKKFVPAWIGAFVIFFLTDWLIHGMLLKQTYMDTAHLWRGESDTVMWAMLMGQLTLPLFMTWIFTQNWENKGLSEGARYGVWIGLLLIPTNWIFYAVMPLPLSLALFWSVGGFAQCVLAGTIMAWFYRTPSQHTASAAA